MKLALLAIAATFVSTVVGRTVTNYVGRGDTCRQRGGLQGVHVITSCGPNLRCVDGICEDVPSLSLDVQGCIESLNKMGANVKSGDVAFYKGYCYSNSCHSMYDKINSCNDPESYCGGGCKYCIKTNNLKCVRKPSGGFLGGLLGRL